jgi:hypothetical protein
MEQIENFKTPAEFIREVEDLVNSKHMEYIDAVLYICEQKGMELETAASLIKTSMVLKSKIHDEGANKGFLKRTAGLPL